jgi:hypothetical protein
MSYGRRKGEQKKKRCLKTLLIKSKDLQARKRRVKKKIMARALLKMSKDEVSFHTEIKALGAASHME